MRRAPALARDRDGVISQRGTATHLDGHGGSSRPGNRAGTKAHGHPARLTGRRQRNCGVKTARYGTRDGG